jgi:uncharacterized protein
MQLSEAMSTGEFVSQLRERPELVHETDEHGVSALLLSLYLRADDAREALLAAGAPIGPLEAAALGDVERLADADLSVRGGDGFTLLHLASFYGHADAVRLLLERGANADADADNPFGVRPIHSAAASGDYETVRALLEAGADPNVTQQGGYTPLDAALHQENEPLAELLRAHGAVNR